MAQKIQKKYIGDNQVGSSQILIEKDGALKGINQLDAEVDLLKINAEGKAEILGQEVLSSESIEDAIANGVIDKAPSQNAVFDALALKQASIGTGTTSQYLRGDLTWDDDLVNRISAMEGYKQQRVYVDDVAGVDAVGRGSFMQPFKTINYAYSQVPSLGNPTNTTYNASVGQFVTEKLIIELAPGRYTENVVLGFKRARVEIVGNGATIVGDVKMSVKLADFPASNLDSLKANFPAPYTGASAFMNFQLTGTSGGGLESDPTGNVLVVTGQAILAFEEPTFSGSNWDVSYGQFYTYLRQVSVGNLVVTSTYTTNISNALPAGVIEVDSCNIASTATAYRMFTGLVPHTYLTDFANWNLASKGATNKAPGGTWTLKAHNSTFGNVIGPRLAIGEMDGCRIYDIDRTMRGTVDNGSITGSTSTSYVGFVNNQFRIYGGSGDLASAYKIGQTSGTTRYKMDSVSYTTLAFSRNSSGVLTARTLDVGGGVSYDFLDDARSIFVAAPATNYTRTVTTVDSSLEGINTSLGTKQASIGTGTTSQYLRGDLTWQTISGFVADEINDGVTNIAPSQNAVYDALQLKLSTSLKGAVNGLAELDSNGKVVTSQLPAIAITDTYVAASESAMLALTAQTGDVAVRSDILKSFILAGTDPSVLADWQELLSPTGGVQSVNGQTGTVSLDSDDIAEGSTNQYFTNTRAKQAIVFDREKIVLNSTDITNQYVDLATLINGESLVAFNMRLALHETDDYVLSTVGGLTRLTFAGDSATGGNSALEVGDILRFIYVIA